MSSLAPTTTTSPPDPVGGPSLLLKVVRYAVGTMVAAPANLALYWVLLVGVGWYEPVANLVAALTIAVPRFALNKWWVWRLPGRERLGPEVRAHLLLTGIGLALSTVVAWALAQLGARPALLLVGNVGSFALTSAARFVACDRWVFRSKSRPGGPNLNRDRLGRT